LAGIDLPDDKTALTAKALDIIAQCRSSVSQRAALCRTLDTVVDTGRVDGERAIINKLQGHHDRLASHLFSPTELRFGVDAESAYQRPTLDRMKVAGRVITRQWERNNTDMRFGQGVYEALKYGSCFLKQWCQAEADGSVRYHSNLVMPWQFGVFNESVNDLSRQPAMVETSVLTLPEVWNRIWMQPDAEALYKRIAVHARQGSSSDEGNSFFHDVMSTSQLNTSGAAGPITNGGVVSLTNGTAYAAMGPQLAVPVVKMHELWVWGNEDWVTIQIIEPDILVTRYKKANLLIPGDRHSGLHPYTLIQPNVKWGYLWGRPESADLIEPQALLATWADDVKRLFGLQIDKILAFTGDGIQDEMYDQSRQAGYFNLGQGAGVTDLTPKFPDQALPMLKMMMDVIDMIGGFDNQLSGKGEPGVRSADHSNQLMKMAAPRLRDRSLLVERQCAQAADLTLHLMQAKDGDHYWTDANKVEETRFLLSDLPDDCRVTVDSHSGSPIFKDDHVQLIALGMKAGLVPPHYAIDNLDFPDKEALHLEMREKEAKEAAVMKELIAKDPEAVEKILSKKRGH
jgi:hypothetical protein